jgi:predicted lipoprotein with Yx(FWY)xxD motif
MERMRRPAAAATLDWALRLAGGALLAVTGAIHLDLYLTGYRSIPTIGWLFLLQVIAAFVLAAAVLATGSRLAAAAGAGFALSTLGGYILSVWTGLFGFTEVRTTAGIAAGVIEVAAFAALAILAARPGPSGKPARGGAVLARLRSGIPGAGRAVTGVSAVALVVLGVALAQSAAAPSTTTAAGGRLQAGKVGGATVLTNAKGFTLYWFAPDTATRSVCNGTCATYWPPVTGTPVAGPGVTGKLGTIRRSDGSTQATFNGHPLYTYIADSAPGQARGNDIDLNGGFWYDIKLGS